MSNVIPIKWSEDGSYNIFGTSPDPSSHIQTSFPALCSCKYFARSLQRSSPSIIHSLVSFMQRTEKGIYTNILSFEFFYIQTSIQTTSQTTSYLQIVLVDGIGKFLFSVS